MGIAKLTTHINSIFKSKISSCPQKPLILLIFYFHQSNGVNYCFILISQLNDVIELLFKCLLAIQLSSSVNCLLKLVYLLAAVFPPPKTLFKISFSFIAKLREGCIYLRPLAPCVWPSPLKPYATRVIHLLQLMYLY